MCEKWWQTIPIDPIVTVLVQNRIIEESSHTVLKYETSHDYAMEGHLKKLTTAAWTGRSWKPGYFKLIPGGLAYYKERVSPKARGFIRVGAETTVDDLDNRTDRPRGPQSAATDAFDVPFCFVVTDLKREYRFKASSKADQMAWYNAISSLALRY